MTRSTSGKHRSGATESGPTPHQVIGVAGVFTLVLMAVLLAVGVVARSDADAARAASQVESGQIGLDLVSGRPASHRTELLASRFMAERRAYALTALRIGDLAAKAVTADEATVAALTAGDTTEAVAAAGEADAARREIADNLQHLRDSRARLAATRSELTSLGTGGGGVETATAGEAPTDAAGG